MRARARRRLCVPLAVGLSQITVSENEAALEALKEAPAPLMWPKISEFAVPGRHKLLERSSSGERGRETWR